MSTEQIDKPTSRALIVLSLAFFIQATTALSVVGAFDAILSEWKLTATSAALLVTAFGATFAVSAPILQMLIGHWVRRTQILTGLSVMAVGALGFALAPNYPLLFSSRILMGLGAALISPVLSALGSSLVKPAQQGGALAVVLMGYSIATVVGVPASSWISQHGGPRWLFVVLALATFGTASLIALLIRDRSPGERVSPHQVSQLFQRPATISALIVIFFISAAIFTTYTMITPIMQDVYGTTAQTITAALLLYGVAGIIGNLFVRKAAGLWSAVTLLKASTLMLSVIFVGLLVLPKFLFVLLIALVIWPFVNDIFWPSQQRRIVELEPAFRGIALALNSSFMFTGVAVGSALGGVIYPAYGFTAVLLLSVGLLVSAFGTLAYSAKARKTNRESLVIQTLKGELI